MSFRRLTAAALALMVLAGCAPDTMAPGGGRDAADAQAGLPGAASAASEAIYDDLSLLAQYIVPNPDAILTKFDALVAVLEVGGSFDAALADLIEKIHLEYAKYTTPPQNGDPNQCVLGDPCEQTLTELYVQVIRDIYLYVGLLDGGASICALPLGHDAETCEIPTVEGEQGKGFVYFPPGLFSQLTFVSIRTLPEEGVDSGLDEYGVTLEIRTAPVSSFPNDKPTVVACVPQGLETAVLNRLLLGHRRTEEKGGGFSLLPETDLGGISLEDYAVQYCGEPQPVTGSGGPSFFGMTADSPVGRLLSRAGNFFLPERLSATNVMVLAARGFSGASGSPEEFSTFKAVDRGVTGAGGSPEEFAPQAGAEAPTAALAGVAGTTATSGLPFVIVQTPAGGVGVAGVKVIFSLGSPAEGLPVSNASLCDGQPTTATTGSDGKATLPCLNFGTTVGYKNLQVTFDPTEVLTGPGFAPGEEPCMIGADGACDNNVTANFLIETLEIPAELSCSLGDKVNKVSLGAYNSTTSVWTGWFEFSPELPGRIRQVSLNMSVSGRASDLSNYPVKLTAFRGTEGGDVLSVGDTVLNSSHGNLELPGDNGSSYPVVIGLTPSTTVTPNYDSEGKVVFKLEVEAPSNRTPQLWYRTDKFDDPSCLEAIVYANGLTPTTAANKDTKAGLGLIINNTDWP